MTKDEIQKNSEHWYNKYKDAEKRITELENKIADIKANCDLAIEGRDVKIKELEKENAELKDDNKVMADNYSKMEQKFYNNLTKAKVIITNLIELVEFLNEDNVKEPIIEQAEQFKKEIEK